jgi:hypothetical protein
MCQRYSSDLARGGDVEWLAQYLARRRTMDIGLDDRPELDRRAAEAIVAWNSRGRPAIRFCRPPGRGVGSV